MRGKLRKVARCPATLLVGVSPEPGDDADDIHGRGIQELLEMRTGQAQVATLPEIKPPNALGQRTLDPGPQRVLGFERGGLLAVAGGLEGFMLRLRPDRQLPGGVFGRGTGTACRTRPTGGTVKPDTDDRIPGDIMPRGPFDTAVPLGTVRLLGLPIEYKGL